MERIKKNINNTKLLFDESHYMVATEKYKSISIFSFVNGFWVVILINIAILIWSGIDYFFSGFVIVFAIVTFPIFLMLYIYCYSKVNQYNKSMKNRIIVKGIITQDLVYTHAIPRRPARIIISYVYTDPKGVKHEENQWIYQGLSDLRGWYYLFSKGKKIDVLLNKCNFDDSYVPMSELYSIHFLKHYFVQINI